jgi:putative hydrolase of the HAD superfamily
MAEIKNVVFDIGNVLVRWDPLGIVERAFGLWGEEASVKRDALFRESDLWHALNRGEMTEAETKAAFVAAGLLSLDEVEAFFLAIYANMLPIEGTSDLMSRLCDAGYSVFALTDNVREVVAHLSTTRDWWSLFDGVTNSAEIGVLKPDPMIYRHLLETNGLVPDETVFLDDMDYNVVGAHAMGMQAFVFTDAAQAERDLRSIGVRV